LSPELAAVRPVALASPPPAVAPPTLVVQLEEHPIDSTRYVLRHWVNHRPGNWIPEPGDPITLPQERAHQAVAALVLRAEEIWSARPGRASLEFVLPVTLLNESVDWWPTEPDQPEAVPLCVEYPVVIRSLERMRTLSYHRVWRNRWEQMLTAVTLRALWALDGEGDNINQWNVRLRRDQTYTAVVLGDPPTTSRATWLKMAVRAGVPVILWDRREQGAKDFREVVGGIVSGFPMSVSDRVAELRASAARDGGAGHLGRHLAVLWDDPERLVDIPPFATLYADGHAREKFDSE
jgi:vWA-MoxR associated protein C-terminal domain